MTREVTSGRIHWTVDEAGPMQSTAGPRWRFTFTPVSRGEEVLRSSDRPLDEYDEGELRALLEGPDELA